MANGFPAKVEAPAPRKQKPNFYACESCGGPLVGQWVTRDGGKVRNPDDDTNHCFKCAGLVELAKVKPTNYRLIFGLGVVAWPTLAYLLPMAWRMVFK